MTRGRDDSGAEVTGAEVSGAEVTRGRGGSGAEVSVNHPNHGEETETLMVWPHLKILWYGEDNSAEVRERTKKERKTEEEMER